MMKIEGITEIDYYLPLYLGVELVCDYCNWFSLVEVQTALMFWKIYIFNAL